MTQIANIGAPSRKRAGSRKTLKMSARAANVESVKDVTLSSSVQKSVKAAAASALKVYAKYLPQIQKRDGRIVAFDFDKTVIAISKAMAQTGEGSEEEAALVAHKVAGEMVQIARKYKNFLPTVEGCQDEVERQLILAEYPATAKSYILYRAQRAQLRAERIVEVPEHVRALTAESARYFEGNPLGEFVFLRSYARWVEAEQRRETWIETVDRYLGFMKENLGDKLAKKEYAELREAILKQEVMPSMRLMQFAGNPARKCNVCAYNCSFIAPSKIEDFAEIMYLSMMGTGVGYSVESQNIQQLPLIKKQSGVKHATHVVADSKEGWCEALTMGLKTWFDGKDIDFDYSLVRPAGARLKTMGGKASGPEPLISLLAFARQSILARQGKRLSNLNAHDIICKIGECVVSGGVRRSAMISLSDLDDEAVRDAKKGQFFLSDPHRSIANNSAVYETKPTTEEFMDEWIALIKSKSGERGIFNRGSLTKTMPIRRVDYLHKKNNSTNGNVGQTGTNPCGEIILQSKQFCNLTEVVARAWDTEATLLRKTKLAALLGTYQSTLTDFKFLSKEWKENCEAERLLGVSMTGQWDSTAARDPKILLKAKKAAIDANQRYAKRFGVNPSNSVTCVKPSGTVSQLTDSSSGMHPRHSPFYIRRIRISATDSLFKMLKDQGVPYHPEVGQTLEDANTFVLEFPVKAPQGSVFKDDLTALQQLEYWKMVKLNFTEHNPSVTISVGENEWVAVANWIYENWDIVGGLSFLPRSDHVYRLAPYEPTDQKTYEELSKKLAHIDYSKLYSYERKDETDQKRELACAGGTCEII